MRIFIFGRSRQTLDAPDENYSPTGRDLKSENVTKFGENREGEKVLTYVADTTKLVEQVKEIEGIISVLKKKLSELEVKVTITS